MRLPQPSSTRTCSARDSSAELPPGSELGDFHITEDIDFKEEMLIIFLSEKDKLAFLGVNILPVPPRNITALPQYIKYHHGTAPVYWHCGDITMVPPQPHGSGKGNVSCPPSQEPPGSWENTQNSPKSKGNWMAGAQNKQGLHPLHHHPCSQLVQEGPTAGVSPSWVHGPTPQGAGSPTNPLCTSHLPPAPPAFPPTLPHHNAVPSCSLASRLSPRHRRQ